MITGGGTGGHLFPGIAIADAFLRRFPKGEIMFVGTDRYMDAQALAQRPFAKATITCQPLKGKSMIARLKAVVQLPVSLLQAVKVIRKFRPALVVGVGGYVTGPVVVAARLMGIITCIHEQNSIPGLANRKLGRVVDRVFLSIPGSERFFPKGKTVLTGNPVREEILASSSQAEKVGEISSITLLVLGGSQGAHRLNELVTDAVTEQKDLPQGFRVIHQTGRQDEQWVREKYNSNGVAATVSAFFDDMPTLYQEADLVVSRAGATTLAELTALGKPSILVPFPFAADGHQEKNGQFLVEGGGAKMFREQELDAARLSKEMFSLLRNKEELQQMAERAHKLGNRDATEKIVDSCLSLMRDRGFSGNCQ